MRIVYMRTYCLVYYDDDDESIDSKPFLWSRDFERNDDEYDNTINGYTHACHAHWSSWIRYVRRNSDFLRFRDVFFIFLSLSLLFMKALVHRIG